MPFTQKPMRYAHSDGHTDLCFDDDGRYVNMSNHNCQLTQAMANWHGHGEIKMHHFMVH